MNKLNELRKKETTTSLKVNEIRKQISKIEREEKLPSIKKKYEGKYFKVQNCYSGDTYWPLYQKVEKVDDVRWFKGWSFQTDSYGKISIEKEKSMTINSIGTEITKKQFDAAYKTILNRIHKLKGSSK